MKIQSPWMGRVKGSAGNMTGSKIYDKNVLRAKAFEVSNPNTTAQQTERSFFAQVADCCASVSEEQLRSLFGVKPKSMSRRNALTKQLSAAFTIDGNEKVLDFSKLPAIGNGEKVNVEMVKIENGLFEANEILTDEKLGISNMIKTNIILVVFNEDDKKIQIVKENQNYGRNKPIGSMIQWRPSFQNGYFYPTCAVGGGNVYFRDFGSFIIKTRAEK